MTQENTIKSNKQLTKANYEILCALLTGKYLRASISDATREEMSKHVGYTNYGATIKKLEEMGVIEGYVPVLSVQGRKLLEAMRIMYGESKNDKAVDVHELEEM